MDNVKTLNRITKYYRQQLKIATELVGSKINPAKTEIITPQPYDRHVVLAKSEFKWLGYTLKINTQDQLVISDTQLTIKMNGFEAMFNDLLGYISNIKTRIKMYKVWAAPALEFFMLQEIMQPSRHSCLEPIQHKLITRVLNVKRAGTPMKAANEVLHEMDVITKSKRFAAMLYRFSPTRNQILDDELTATDYEREVRTRSGTKICNTLYSTENTLTLKILQLAKEWAVTDIQTLPPKFAHIDYKTIHLKISELRQLRGRIIAEATNIDGV